MKVRAFDEQELRSALHKLDRLGQVAFAACAASRAAPSYQAFAERTGMGDWALVDRCKTSLWQQLRVGSFEESTDTGMERELLHVVPDESPDWEPWTSSHAYAESACTSLIYAVRAAIADPLGNAVNSARCALEVAEQFAGDEGPDLGFGPQFEALVSNHQLVQMELQRQECDLADLTDAGEHRWQQSIALLQSRAIREPILPS